ncbi:hypothetical protein HJC23_008536 [Cyclotella cryptica]|uniref:Uncharacterized protein n=1 Tax=Cyclotella cryptica TaxID=29204 RepID=A0ABD3QYB0_9STRA
MMTFYSLFDADIDLSFALPKETPFRRQRSCLLPTTRQSFGEYYLEDELSLDRSRTRLDSESRRSVKFAENPISEVIPVPRYEKERIPELFYNHLDVARFRHEVKLERMHIKILW